MLEALQDLGELIESVQVAGLPALATGHRIVRDDRCHFVAPASMPDESSPAAGQLLLTNRRAIFVGAVAPLDRRGTACVRCCSRSGISCSLATGRDALIRFRCNGFSDALRAAFIARTLTTTGRGPAPGL